MRCREKDKLMKTYVLLTKKKKTKLMTFIFYRLKLKKFFQIIQFLKNI